MTRVAIVDAVRTPIGRRNGGLSTVHPVDLLGTALRAVVERSGIDPGSVDQVVGGCVTTAGEQAFNISRTAWLSAGLPLSTASTTVDSQCGSSQQALNLAAGLVATGGADVVIAGGVESMSRVGMGASMMNGPGSPIPPSYPYGFASQFEGAELIAEQWGITRDDTDRFGFASQERAAQAWAEGRFDREVVPVEAAVPDAEDGAKVTVARDEGLRGTSLDKLSTLKPVGRPNGVHTAGSSSQVSDGAAAVLLMSEDRAHSLGLPVRAVLTHQCLVGVDPKTMLTGPIDATERLLDRSGTTIDDFDLFEINEAFASVVLAWARASGADLERTNVNGGAIAIGHPLGASGVRLVTTALHELERRNGTRALISMCCGGGLGTGSIIERPTT